MQCAGVGETHPFGLPMEGREMHLQLRRSVAAAIVLLLVFPGAAFAVDGTGVLTATASPNPVHFGNVPVNTTVTQSVTITVDAGYRTEVASGSGLNPPFAFGFDTCGAVAASRGPERAT